MHRLLRRYYGTYWLEPTKDAGAIGRSLEAYFEGELEALDGIPVRMRGTEFQTGVWAALRRIPAGTAVTYSGLAAQLGRPAACRAVGLAEAAQ
jgi:methylated-DNA-[protein]-cysteine S-methyltransferase